MGIAGNVAHPLNDIQIPKECFANPGFKYCFGVPTERAFNLASVDGVAPVLTGMVREKRDVFRIVENEIAANEPGAAGNKNGHKLV